jgi:hypothetical protein
VLQKFSLISSLLPIIFFLLFCLRTKEKGLWVIFFYVITSLFFDAILLTTMWGISYKYILWNIFILVEFSFFSYFFYLTIKLRVVKSLIILCFIIFIITYFLYGGSDKQRFNSLISAIEAVIFLFLSLSYFMIKLKPTAEPVNIFTPIFFAVFAILLYVTSTLFLYIIANSLTLTQFDKYWSINDFANILCNLIYSFAFILYGYQKKSLTPENHTVDYTSPNDR